MYVCMYTTNNTNKHNHQPSKKDRIQHIYVNSALIKSINKQ